MEGPVMSAQPKPAHEIPPDETFTVLTEVGTERVRQIAKWGEQNHDPAIWLAILGEEFGEASREVLEARAGDPEAVARYRRELLQVAAVATAAVEAFDRGGVNRPGRAS